jgi:hypothetical protein
MRKKSAIREYEGADGKRSTTYKLSNFSISAWEYAAPTTRFGSRPVRFGVPSRGPRQNGDEDLKTVRLADGTNQMVMVQNMRN